jgi:hypothetical protein
MDNILQTVADQAGIHFMGVDAQLQQPQYANNWKLAMDAQPALVTTSNSGIPAFLSTFVDPKLIEVLVSPMKAAEVAGGEIKKGDWVTETAMFPVVESTGEVSTYGDNNENGSAGTNVNWVNRQSYHYQVVTQWGEKELARMALGKIDLANQLNISSVLTLNKFQNKSYFFGVSGLENYGLLNDPALPASITPNTKTAGGTSWANGTALEIYNDIVKLYSNLVTRSKGLVELETQMTMALSPISQGYLTRTNEFNVNVFTLIKSNYPNMKIVTAPEYSTVSGELVQLYADNIEGQKTAEVAFTEKLRAHPIVVGMSNFKQKKSQGTWGGIIYRPMFVSSMLGV